MKAKGFSMVFEMQVSVKRIDPHFTDGVPGLLLKSFRPGFDFVIHDCERLQLTPLKNCHSRTMAKVSSWQ